MGIFQLAMLVYWRVKHNGKKRHLRINLMMMLMYQLSGSFFSLARPWLRRFFKQHFFFRLKMALVGKKCWFPCVAAECAFWLIAWSFLLVEKQQQQLPGASKSPQSSEGKSLRNHHLTKYLGE